MARQAVSILPALLGAATSILCLLPAIVGPQSAQPMPAGIASSVTGAETCAGPGSVPWDWGLTGDPSLRGDAPSASACGAPTGAPQGDTATALTLSLHAAIWGSFFTKPVEQNVFAASSQPVAPQIWQ